MILLKPDKVTLFYFNSAGAEVDVTPAQWVLYSQLNQTMAAQAQAATDNTQAVSNYLNRLNTYQQNLNNGRPDTPPAVPQQKVVDDATGTVSYIPFSPQLPVAVPPVTLPSAGSGFGTPPSVPDDREDAIIKVMLQVLNAVMAIKAKVGA